MRLRSLGALSAAVLFTNGLAFGQNAGRPPDAGAGSTAYDWLSPAQLKWSIPGFNWSELPVKMYIAESLGYNSNIFNASSATVGTRGLVPGDYFLRTNVGASTKINVEGQKFFTDISYGNVDYRRDTNYNQHNHSMDGGVNWQQNSHCSGTFIISNQSAEAAQNEAAAQGIDILTSNQFSGNSVCHLYQDIGVITSFSASSVRHSLLVSQPLDSNAISMQAGLQYSWNGLDNVQFILRDSDTKYVNIANYPTNNTAHNTVNLVYATVVYNYTVSPKLNFSLSGGVSEDLSLSGLPGTTSTSALQPNYAVSVNYIVSDKVNLQLSSSHTVSAPTSILARTQTTSSQSASVSYAWTPKISLQASLTSSLTQGATTTFLSNPAAFGNNKLLAASIGGSYTITPFTSLTFSASSSNRTLSGTNVPTNIITMGLDYRPY